MSERYCKVCDGWHDLDKPWPHNCLPEAPQRSTLPAPFFVCDTMEPVQSMVDGKFYTSKSALRATYQPSGNKEGKRYVELGNDSSVLSPKPFQKPRPKREEIRAAVRKAASRVGLGA